MPDNYTLIAQMLKLGCFGLAWLCHLGGEGVTEWRGGSG